MRVIKEILSGAVALAIIAASCGGSSSSGAGTGGASGTGGTPGSGGAIGSGGMTNESDAGEDAKTKDTGGGATGGSVGSNGTMITGSADGNPFTNIGSVLWAGMPDVAASTVIYVFSKPIKCSDITKAGWDTTITNMTQILEVKAMGTTAAVYQPIIKAPRLPAAGEAQVNYTLSLTSGTPTEAFATAGSVTLSKVTATTNVTGSFDLMFGANALKGTFDATYCAAGREP
ncbi:MAG: hypothetical protein QOI66_1581 [Myxococcales bacterium]|jgi:hypothetical protein|nr:hypothetical protein [Myxococcales bacterium]